MRGCLSLGVVVNLSLGVVVNWLGPLGVSVLRDRDGADAGALTLLTAGVIVQFRSGDGPDDSTVKLRPCPVRRHHYESAMLQWYRAPGGAC